MFLETQLFVVSDALIWNVSWEEIVQVGHFLKLLMGNGGYEFQPQQGQTW